MPFAYSSLSRLRLLSIRGTGVISQSERIETLRAWLADPAYPECDAALCDFSETSTTPSMEELRELLTVMLQHRPAGGPRRLAIVTSKAITYIVAREFK